MTKIVDGRLPRGAILEQRVTGRELSYLFQSGLGVAIGSVAAWVSFPVVYGQVPVVVASPMGALTQPIPTVMVNSVTTTQFMWISNVPGSASWIAYGVK